MTFDLDANGIVGVKAKDQATGREQRITITASSGLSKAEIDRMVRDAELHADEDKRRKEELETKNRADSLLHNAEKTLADAEGKVDAGLIGTARDAAAGLRAALGGSDMQAVSARTDTLTDAVYAVSSALYQQANSGDGGASSSYTAPDDNGYGGGNAPEDTNGYNTAADDGTGTPDDRTAQFTGSGEPAGAAAGTRTSGDDDVVEGEFREER